MNKSEKLQDALSSFPSLEPKTHTDKELTVLVSEIRRSVHPSKSKYLKRHAQRIRHGVVFDKLIGDTLDAYYVDYINDTLKSYRKGEFAYLYKIGQVRDFLTFEPDAVIIVNDGIFHIVPKV